MNPRTASARGSVGVLERVPTAAWLCAIVAGLSAATWSIVTPAFEVPDEQAHYAYVAQLAETGQPPSSSVEINEPEELVTLFVLRYYLLRHQPRNHALFSDAEQRSLEEHIARIHQLHLPIPARGAGVATSEPPLYYALETIPYSLASTALGRLPLMRLLSVCMAAITALFTLLFVREALPRDRWAWVVGGLCVALVPLFGFISGAVNPDSMLFAVSAVLFYCLARAFRRGLTPRLTVAIAIVIVTGCATKLNFVGLLPGALVGLAILGVRAARTSGRFSYRSLAVTCAVVASPVALYAIVNALSRDPTLGSVSTAFTKAHLSLGEIDYIWQFYLPRLPGMPNDFPGIFTARALWFDGYVGLYGWLDTTFPAWVYNVALIPAVAVPVSLVGTFAVMYLFGFTINTLSLLAMVLAIGLVVDDAIVVVEGVERHIEEGMTPKDAALKAMEELSGPVVGIALVLSTLLALAVRGAGRRSGQAVGASLVVLFLAHDVFSQLLVVSRFYG